MTASSPEVLDAIRRFERESAERLEAARVESAALVNAARSAAEAAIERARRDAGEQASARAESFIVAAREEASNIEADAADRIDRLRANARIHLDAAVAAMVALVAPEEKAEV
jgi:vacuolar-type H+-ATPase subunit H